MTFPVEEYAKQIALNGGLNIEFKAVNYREDKDKSADGNRPLAIALEYSRKEDGTLTIVAHFDTPGEYRCNDIAENIRNQKGDFPRSANAESAVKTGMNRKKAKNTRKSKADKVRRENAMEDAKSKFVRDRIEEIKAGKLNATQIGGELQDGISGKQIRKVRQWKANIAGYDIIFVE